MGGGGDVKSEDTTITFSRGCSKPLAVDHTTINIKSKGSGRWAVNVSNENTSNAKQQSTVKRETGFADIFAVCTSCVSLLKSDNEYLT
jgi:hypothetical protein